MTAEGQPIPPNVQIRTPERWTAGVYANGVGVWSTQTEFTVDFLINLPAEPVPTLEIVARVKVPPALVFQLLRNLSDGMSNYEAQWGKIPDFKGSTIGRSETLPEEGET